jgi:hypothetical protein
MISHQGSEIGPPLVPYQGPPGTGSESILRMSAEQAIERALDASIAFLGELKEGPEHPYLRCRQVDLEQRLLQWLCGQVGDWIRALESTETQVLRMLEYARRCCYRLHDQTLAYSTVICFAQALIEQIGRYLSASRRKDTVTPRATGLMLQVLLEDVGIFQAIGRSDTVALLNALDHAINGTLPELREAISAGGPSLDLWRQELLDRYRGEGEALRMVYVGVRRVTSVVMAYQAFLLADEPLLPSPALPHAHRGQRAKALVNQMAETGRTLGLDLELLAREGDSYGVGSRLAPWRASLLALGDDLRTSPSVLRITRGQVRYCFPFAVDIPADRIRDLRDDFLSDRGVPEATGGVAAAPTLRGCLTAGLRSLGYSGTDVNLRPLRLTEFWLGAGSGLYGGGLVELPGLLSEEEPSKPWRVWIELSRLGNHCLCVERTIVAPTPSSVCKALREAGDSIRSREPRYRVANQVSTSGIGGTATRPTRDGSGGPQWRSLDEFASDVIRVTAGGVISWLRPAANDHLALGRFRRVAALSAPGTTERIGDLSSPKTVLDQYVQTKAHVVAVVVTPESLGSEPRETTATLVERHGGKLFLSDISRVASSLEEWVRYPLLGGAQTLVVSPGFGFREDWVARMPSATTIGVVGSASWQTDAYVEAAQFAASWSPVLLLWERKVRLAVEGSGFGSRALRDLERSVRLYITSVHSADLCRIDVHRRFLDALMLSVGATSTERELERQLRSVELSAEAQERETLESSDNRRNILLGVLTIFGVLNLSTFFQMLDIGSSSGLLHGKEAVLIELGIQVFALLSCLGVFWFIYFGRRQTGGRVQGSHSYRRGSQRVRRSRGGKA